jgi:3-hydroxybutyryl-CoA dehydratase
MAIEKGQKFSADEKVDKYRAIYYAGASGDFNPIHIDADFGKMVGLGGTILQGLCTLAFTSKTVTDWLGDPGKLKRLKCRFSAPVMMEDTVTVQGEVTSASGGAATISLKVSKQTGQEVLTNVTAEATL